MYEYTYDTETGGILILDTLKKTAKEPRPVYAQELDILGFDKYWKYEKQNEAPYFWAESSFYFYRGVLVARTLGGSLFQKPKIVLKKDKKGTELLPIGTQLEKVDLTRMVAKNSARIDALEKFTTDKIREVYQRYKDQLDCFHVSFSGGKDSVVLLENVKKAIPRGSFFVIFGDTGMEYPDTYRLVDKIENRCCQDGVPFYRAKSRFKPEESWRLFGVPSRCLRWCHSVHKVVPQSLKIREIVGKSDYVGMDFVGVRASESIKRSRYQYEGLDKEQTGQYSFNPLLEWNSAEIWLYLYSRGLLINDGYKKGNSRAGCVFCPCATDKAAFFRRASYPEEVDKFINIIKETVNDKKIDSYIENGGWGARLNGRDLFNNPPRYHARKQGKDLIITIRKPTSNWREWIKTVDEIPFKYSVLSSKEETIITFKDVDCRNPKLKWLKQVFKKAAYCIGCQTCEMNCPNGAIKFNNGLEINNCCACGKCHLKNCGCLAFVSLQQPKREWKDEQE